MSDSENIFVHLRGIPFECKEDEIRKFLKDVKCESVAFKFRRDGRLSGDVFVKVRGRHELEKALKHDRENIGRRYVEVFEANADEVSRASVHQVKKDGTVRLRGLPFDVTKADISDFFWGLEIVPEGIGLLLDHNGEPNGEAFVQFVTTDDADKALEKTGGKIGHRYIEVFSSSLAEANEKIKQLSAGYGAFTGYGPRGGGRSIGVAGRDAVPRDFDRYRNRSRDRSWEREREGAFDLERRGNAYGAGPFNSANTRSGPFVSSNFGYDNSGFRTDCDFQSVRTHRDTFGRGNERDRTTRHSVRMRGLPFSATEADVLDFFRPMHALSSRIEYQRTGRPTGHAEVDFASHEEAVEAMKHDRQQMGTRYIELFLHSEPR